MQEKNLQWHPAFYADLQIELQGDRENLIFENEHLLGTKPTQIDVLVVKKEKDVPVKKNIGRIFKKHNIIEYKGPTDYLNIDDYYKGYAYACFYKSQTKKVNEIDIADITITFVCKNYPKTLIMHLKDVKKYEVEEIESGIYYINGDNILMQIIVIRQLSEAENLWLRSLTNELVSGQEAEKLFREYQKHKSDKLYESVMDIIVRANEMHFKEGRTMCKALEELMEDLMGEKLQEQLEEKLQEQLEEKLQEQLEEKLQEQLEEKLQEKMGEKTEALKREGSDTKAMIIVKNMLLRGMSDVDIKALAECDQNLIEDVRKQLS